MNLKAKINGVAGILLIGAMTVSVQAATTVQSGNVAAGLRKLMDTPIRDPSICVGPDGTYYLTGTSEPFWGFNNEQGIRIWKSKERVKWEPLGTVWRYGESPWHKKYLEAKKPLWAPEIHYLKGTFWLTYSIPGWDGTGKTSGSGLLKSTSGKPEGPYVDMQPAERLGDEIDATLFQEDNGDLYFAWHSGKIAKLKPDMSGLAEPYHWLKAGTSDTNKNHHAGLCAGIFGKDSFDHVGFEGMFLFKREGRYYLCCSDQMDGRYSCLVATSTNLLGPYSERYEAIQHGGHNAFFTDPQGQMWSTFFGPPYSERAAVLPVHFDEAGRLLPGKVKVQKTFPSGRVEHPLNVGDVHDFGGFIGERMQANKDGYLKPFNIDAQVKIIEERQHRAWWWVGEQAGKWLESAVIVSRQTGDAELEKKARETLRRMIASQEADGYLGVTPKDVRTPEKPLRGMDPYELYFTLHGLLTAYEQWGDKPALEAARKLGDYFVKYIGPGKAEFWPSPLRPPENVRTIITAQHAWVPEGTKTAAKLTNLSEIAGHTAHYGWEGTLLIDPMLRLAKVSGEKKYADWGGWVINNIDTWSGWDAFSNLDQVAKGTMGVHQLQPYVHSHTFQMNFLGFLRMYEITGDPSYLRKVAGAWDDVAERQMYITGGVSVGEHYEKEYIKPNVGGVVETCATMSWLQLTQYLLELTGDVKYADAMERLILNHVFASQTVDGDSYRYHTPPNGLKPVEYFHGPDCCTASGHRVVSLLPLFFYAKGKACVYVNQYVPSSATVGLEDGLSVKLKQETQYPAEETIVIRVDPSKKSAFSVNVRIPGWCQAPTVKVNGHAIDGVKPGSYAPITRTWKAGDVIEMKFPMTVQWMTQDERDGNGKNWALMRGPVVYALDTVWWQGGSKAPFCVWEGVGIHGEAAPACKMVAAPARTLGPGIEVPMTLISGQKVDLLMLPFANVGNWYRDRQSMPQRHEPAFSYAVWLPDVNSEAFKNASKRSAELEALKKSSVDFVLIGERGSEKDHELKGESTSFPFNGKSFRHSTKSFSYVIKVNPEVPCQLVCTYWGGEKDKRVFDVLANDRVLATQTLLQNKPNEFFEVRYPIPVDLIQGKTDALGQKVNKVTVKFQPHEGLTAGGVFGLRVETL